MRLVTPSSLVLGLILASPALWAAFNDPAADVTGALLRFVLAVVVSGAGLSFLRGIVAGYQTSAQRRSDAGADGTPSITTLPPTLVAGDDVLPA